MKYVPRKPPAPVTAVLLSKDFHAAKGDYVVISETGGIKSMSAKTFREMHAPEPQPNREPPAAIKTRKSVTRYPITDPRSHVQIVARMAIGKLDAHRVSIFDTIRKEHPGLNASARMADAVRLKVLVIEDDGVIRAGPAFVHPKPATAASIKDE